MRYKQASTMIRNEDYIYIYIVGYIGYKGK